ncbi:MAG: FecCD family ABC transporter permease [Opitutales bacterium]
MPPEQNSLQQFALPLGLMAAVLLSAVFSLSIGTVWLSPPDVLHWLFVTDEPMGTVVRELRAPRTLLALLVGGGLGLVGAALQGYTRNPLADSGLLGINGGAALGAVFVLHSGFLQVTGFTFGIPFGGLIGAAGATFLIAWLTGRVRSIQTLILAGVAVSSLAGALTSLVLNFSPNAYAAREIVFWLMGSVADRSWDHIAFAAPLMAIGAALILGCRRSLQGLTLGDDTAASLGISLTRLRWSLILGCALVVGPATAAAGAIGFVGLVVPHLLRPLVQYDPARLLLASGLGGALLLLWADIFIRLLPMENELKLGVLTALLGAPFFFWLIFRLRRMYP